MKLIPSKLQPWFEARRHFRLSHAHIQMARELGMNPQKFGSLANERQEPWKLPLPEFIAECSHKRFSRSEPENVRSLEEVVQAERLLGGELGEALSSPTTLTQAQRSAETDDPRLWGSIVLRQGAVWLWLLRNRRHESRMSGFVEGLAR